MKLFLNLIGILVVILGLLSGLTIPLSFDASTQEGPGVSHVSPEELKHLIESRADIEVVDTQPKGAYEIGHVKGAVNFPWAADIKNPGRLPRNKELVLYCDCTHEEDSLDTAKQLMTKFSYTNVKVLEGGWSRWQNLGYPTEKGKAK